MRIFIDESGSFQIPNSGETHAAAVVLGVVIPEVSEKKCFEEYQKFSLALDANERRDNEPKGARITRENRRLFCDMLIGFQGVIVIPTTIDLSELAGQADNLTSRLPKLLRDCAANCIHQTMQDETLLLASQYSNLSVTEILKLALYTKCIQECVHHAVAYLSQPPFRDCWSKIEIVIDQVNKKPDSREKQVFKMMLLSWITAWSKKRPLMLIKEIHTPDHPFVQRYKTGTGIDMRCLVGDGLRWADSATEPGLQIADIAAAIVFSAVHDLDNNDDRLSDFLSLMHCCPFAAIDGPGLVTLLRDGQSEKMKKYESLVSALASMFPNRAGTFRGLRQPPPWAFSK